MSDIERLKEIVNDLASVSVSLQQLRNNAHGQIKDFIDDMHPSLFSMIESMESASDELWEYPEGATYEVTTVFKDPIFARSESEARQIHLRLLSGANIDELKGLILGQDVESVPDSNGESVCAASFRHGAK